MRHPQPKSRSILARAVFYSLLFLAYLVSTVPVGLALYGIKSDVGLDIFLDGGFHTYMQCLQSSFPLSDRSYRMGDWMPRPSTRPRGLRERAPWHEARR